MNAGTLIKDSLSGAYRLLTGAGHAALAGAAGAAMLVGGVGRTVRGAARELQGRTTKNQKKTGEVVMKKSTLIALLVALATVAGVLGALYVYVLRRERELDEYEQLLFSEDFNDDVPDDEDDDEPDAAE